MPGSPDGVNAVGDSQSLTTPVDALLGAPLHRIAPRRWVRGAKFRGPAQAAAEMLAMP